MSRFNRTATRGLVTHEGGRGRKPGAEEELALLTVSSFMDDSFYESGNETAERMKELAGRVDKTFLLRLAVFARDEFNMRTNPAALLALYTLNHGQPPASVIDRVFLRGDEIGDYLGAVSYFSDNGKVTPSAVRFGRSVLQRRLTQRNALRYSGGNKNWSLAKAIRITHALSGADEDRSAIMSFILNWHREGSLAKGWDVTEDRERIPLIGAAVRGEDAGSVSWERSRSAGSSWNEVVGDMGFMATLRNLNNFMLDEGFDHWDAVIDQLSDRDEVLGSRQFPFRFLSAKRALGKDAEGHRMYHRVMDALETAVEHSLGSLPELEGRTLVIVDTSGSMSFSTVSERSQMTYADVACLFGASMSRLGNSDVVAFASYGHLVRFSATESVLSRTEKIRNTDVGHGTVLGSALAQVTLPVYSNIVILSDMQLSDSHFPDDLRNFNGNVFAVNLAAYKPQMTALGDNFYSIGGWSDATLRLISTLSGNRGIVDAVNGYEI